MATLFIEACNNETEKSTTQKSRTPDTPAMATKPADSLPAYTTDMLDTRKTMFAECRYQQALRILLTIKERRMVFALRNVKMNL